jgi:hypothetical protein
MVDATTMAAHPGRPRGLLSRLCLFWLWLLDLFYTLWVLRVPVAGVVVGTALLLVPQAEDLFVQLATGSWFRIIEFFLLLFFVWAATTHYGARLLVETDERYLRWFAGHDAVYRERWQTWSPRLLATLPFFAVGGSILWSRAILPQVHEKGVTEHAARWLTILAIITAVMLVLFFFYVVWRRSFADARSVRWAERQAARVIGPLRRFVPGITQTTGVSGRSVESDLGPLYLILMFVLFTGGAFFAPLPFAEAFPRAAAVPFIVGGWLPLLVYLSALGRRFRFPFILSGFLFTWSLTSAVGDNFAVRPIEPRAPTGQDALAQLSLNEALRQWRQANGAACVAAAAACPRPILIAASGGASRAGFFTASVIGQLLDDQLKVDGQGHGLKADTMRNRIFAISSVSGSSVGAVMAVAAMGVAKPGQHPCRTRRGIAPLWHGDPTPINGWRSCFEALMSGDFLTPTLTGFVFRDMLRFLHWADRAALIERSWEKQFAWLIDKEGREASGLACAGDLECPFLTLRPTMTGAEVRWLPLLVINGHSVGTGQRIITSVLARTYVPPTGKRCPLAPRESPPAPCQIFAEAHDFYRLVTSGSDVRLSTGAHNSARFPIISPPGEIRTGRKIVDRIVDGGYFENSGAQSALDLVQAIRTVEPELAPFVLVLANDPELPQAKPGAAPSSPVIALDREGSFLTDVSAPIKAFAHSRDGRGILAVKDVRAALDRSLPPPPACTVNSAFIRVWAELVRPDERKARPLSMSWWLSKPVQLYLHEQTEFDGDMPKDGHENRGEMANMLKGINKDPGCVGAEGPNTR